MLTYRLCKIKIYNKIFIIHLVMLVYSERYNTLWRSLMKLKQLILSSIAVGALAFTFGTVQPAQAAIGMENPAQL